MSRRQPTALSFVDAANLLTLAGLAAGVVCAVLAVQGLIAYAVVSLMVSGLCDLFDGFLARRMSRSDEQRRFGGHLDSVVDACSFGFAPVILMYCAGLESIPEIMLLVGFTCCAVWRLAYFDTIGLKTTGADRFYSGLPTTYVALVLPLAFIPGFFAVEWLRVALVIATVILAVAMVSSVPVRKPGGLSYIVFLIMAVGMVGMLIQFADRFSR